MGTPMVIVLIASVVMAVVVLMIFNFMGAAQTRPGKQHVPMSGSIGNAPLVRKRIDSRLTLPKRLKYAQWTVPPVAFYISAAVISVLAFAVVSTKMNHLMSVLSLATGPMFMYWLVNTLMEKRFKRFDSDYPQFLMSLVGLLKTGMTPMTALESAAEGLEPGSLVKEQVELMIGRLRVGVTEEKSIGAFGEDINHPEIELFVQALLLSRRVGGTLSETLERLAKQVRKRQYFRQSAAAAVSMQRGSIWLLIAMLVGLELYIYSTNPDLVRGGFESEMGWQVWQGAILAILTGIFWVRQVTKLRV